MTKQSSNTVKPQITAQDLAVAMKSSTKKQSADILSDMVNSNGNIHMKTVVNNPMAYTVMHIKAQAFERDGYGRPATLFRDIYQFQEQICVSKRGERAKLVIKAIESVLRQDFEIKKLSNKMLGQGGQK